MATDLKYSARTRTFRQQLKIILMFHLKNIRFLSKVQSALDTFDAPQLILKITIDESFFFPDAIAKTKGNQSHWQQSSFPPIQLASSQPQYHITFIMYHNGTLIGTAKTTVKYGENIKEQNDIVHNGNKNHGLIVYEGEWGNVQGDFITWEQFNNFKQGRTAGNNAIPTTTKSHKVKQYHRDPEDQGCGGLCSCFSTRPPPQRRPPRQHQYQQAKPQSQSMAKTNYYAPNEVKLSAAKKQQNRKPFVYTQKQLGQEIGKNGNNPLKQPLRKLTFYSKVPHRGN